MTPDEVRALVSPLLDAEAKRFVRAVIGPADSKMACWREWQEGTEDWLDPGARRGRLVRAFAPLVFASLEPERLALSARANATLRGWRLMEAERSRLYLDILRDLLERLSDSGFEFMLTGAAASALAFPDPVLRHGHDIEFLCAPADMRQVGGVMAQTALPGAPGVDRGSELTLHHRSGLPIVIRTALLRGVADPALTFEAVRASRRSVGIEGQRVKVPGVTHLLLASSAAAVTTRHAVESIRALVDVWHLLKANSTLTSAEVVACAERHNLTLTLTSALTFLQEECAVPLPAPILPALYRTMDKDDASRPTRFVSTLACAPRHVGALMRLPIRWRTRLAVARAMILPPPMCLVDEGVLGPARTLHVRYARRMMRWLLSPRQR